MKRLLIFILAFCACADLERSNPLDPKNPSSERKMTVLVEAFINASGGEVVDNALAGVGRLMREYGSQDFLYLEHHIARTPETDPLALDASLSRYNFFVPVDTEQGIPDVFFNGSAQRAQGASSPEMAYQRYQDKLQQELALSGYFTIQGRVHRQQDQLSLTADIARLGPDGMSDVSIIAVIGAPMENTTGFLVRGIFPVDTWNWIGAGEVRGIDQAIDIAPKWSDNISVIIVIQNSRTGRIWANAELGPSQD